MNLIGWAKTYSMSADNDGTLGWGKPLISESWLLKIITITWPRGLRVYKACLSLCSGWWKKQGPESLSGGPDVPCLCVGTNSDFAVPQACWCFSPLSQGARWRGIAEEYPANFPPYFHFLQSQSGQLIIYSVTLLDSMCLTKLFLFAIWNKMITE